MPIANCYINRIETSETQREALTREWAKAVKVDLKDVCLTFIETSFQTGQKYKVMVNLFLPSLWGKKDIEIIQLALLNQLMKHLNLTKNDIFIIISIVESGNVVENGQIVKWT